MDYSFNADIAKKYGVGEAVFLHNLYWWIMKNEANGRHYYDGRSWTYNSVEAFKELFPFWSTKQIRRIIKKLAENGLIYIGNYNQKGFDRTQWYALSEEVLEVYQKGKCILPKGQMEVTKRANGCAQKGKPIPDSKPYSKPDNITPISPTEQQVDEFADYAGSNQELLDALKGYEQMRKAIKKPMTGRAKVLLVGKLDMLCRDVMDKERYRIECLETATLNCWKSVYELKDFVDSEPPTLHPVKITPETDTIKTVFDEHTTIDDLLGDDIYKAARKERPKDAE